MSTTFMVKSSLVFLVCHINLVLMTILFLFNISKSTTQHYILSMLQMTIYVFGLLFNLYVILYAGRKWELVVKYFENSTNYLRMMQCEIRHNIMNSIKASMEHSSAVVTSIIETFRQLDLEGSNSVSSKPLAEIEPFTKSTEEYIPRMAAQEETVGRVEIATAFQNESVKNVQPPTSEEKTPEFMKMYNLRSIKEKAERKMKDLKANAVRAQSPELLKNKIFKSRMILTCDSPCSRMDRR